MYITHCYLPKCDPQTSSQSPVWSFAIEKFEAHDIHFTASNEACLSGITINSNLQYNVPRTNKSPRRLV